MTKTLRYIFGNRWVLLALLLYAGSLFVLWRNPAFEGEEAMMMFIVFVVIFPVLAWVATLRTRPLPFDRQPTAREMITLALYFLGLSLYLLGGPQFFDGLLPKAWLEEERVRFFIALVRKLIIFVLLPYAVFRFLFGASLKDFGLSRDGLRQMVRSHLPVVLTVSAAILLFQYRFGGAVAPIRKGELSAQQLMLGLPLCFVWLAVEAGLVEEFCFRGLLQSRLAAWFKSDATSVPLMALVFGLAHAPGFISAGPRRWNQSDPIRRRSTP